MAHHSTGFLIFLDSQPLDIPIYRFRFFDQGLDHPHKCTCFLRKLLGWFMILVKTHGFSLAKRPAGLVQEQARLGGACGTVYTFIASINAIEFGFSCAAMTMLD